jgi:hypothetical protein
MSPLTGKLGTSRALKKTMLQSLVKDPRFLREE